MTLEIKKLKENAESWEQTRKGVQELIDNRQLGVDPNGILCVMANYVVPEDSHMQNED